MPGRDSSRPTTVTWLSEDLSDYDFGVPAAAQTLDRAAYSPGSTSSFAAGLEGLFELSENWRAFLNVTSEFLDSDVRKSPIVEDSTVTSGFAALTYVF